MEHRDLGRDGAVEIHHDLLGMEGVIVVGVAPAQRARRHIAFLVGGGDVGQRLDHRLLHLGIVEMRLAVRRDDVVAAVGDQEVVEGVVSVGRPVGGRLQAVDVDVALGLAQLLLHRLEEVPERIPGLGRVGQLEAGLLDHRVPDVERQHAAFDRNVGVAALLGDVVVVLGRQQRRRMEVILLGLDDVCDVKQLVVPGILRHDRLVGDVVEHDVGCVAAGQARDDLLHRRPEGDEAELDLVAARLLVGRHQVLERFVLFLDEALDPQDARRLGLCIGNERPGDRSRRRPSSGAAQHRTPVQFAHRLPPKSPVSPTPWTQRFGSIGAIFLGYTIRRQQSAVMRNWRKRRSAMLSYIGGRSAP